MATRKDFQGKPVPTKSQKGARVLRGRHLLPKHKARSKVRGHPQERPKDETWLAIDSARPHWQRCLDGTMEKSGEE